jgi:hypothetical protein
MGVFDVQHAARTICEISRFACISWRVMRSPCESTRQRVQRCQHNLLSPSITSISRRLHSSNVPAPLNSLRMATPCVSFRTPITTCVATTVVKWLRPMVVAHARITPLDRVGNPRTLVSRLSNQCASTAGAQSRSQRPVNSKPPESALWIATSSISSSSCTSRHAIAGTILCCLYVLVTR